MGIGKKASIGNIFPIILLVFAIVSTIGIYIYNSIIEGKNKQLDINISGIEAKIKNVEQNPNLQIYNLITNNKKIIERFESHSQVTTFINRMELIEGKYQVIFEGFNYANGVITTIMTNSPDSSIIAYKTVSDFIKGYRLDKGAYFTLPFISRVSGSKKMQLKVTFKVKDILPNAIKSDIGIEKKKTTKFKKSKKSIGKNNN